MVFYIVRAPLRENRPAHRLRAVRPDRVPPDRLHAAALDGEDGHLAAEVSVKGREKLGLSYSIDTAQP